MNSEDAVIQLLNKITIAGNIDTKFKAIEPFNNLVTDFLETLSKAILKDKQAKNYNDLIAFSFWIRKKNIYNLKKRYSDIDDRLGRGIVLHFSSSNIPLNFAYSLVFGLLSGNLNVVRLSSKDFIQINIFIKIIIKLFNIKKFYKIKRMNCLVKYEKEKKINDLLSSICDVRIIWGGDETINQIRLSQIPSKANELTFFDRYSFAILNSESIDKLDKKEMNILCKNFFNDTYYIDQNACSSPHLIIWTGKYIKSAKKYFWEFMSELLEKSYIFQESAVVEKYALLLKNSIKLDNIKDKNIKDNKIYRVSLSSLIKINDVIRGKWGLFYEYDAKNIKDFENIVNYKYQTLSYFGFDKKLLKNLVIKNHLTGIDRIVPIGQTLNIDLIWDGYDVLSSLSRIVNFK